MSDTEINLSAKSEIITKAGIQQNILCRINAMVYKLVLFSDLNKKIPPKKSKISEMKNCFIEIRDTINELDECLSSYLLIDISVSMIAIMSNIYALALSEGNEFLRKHIKSFAFKSVSSALKMIISCFVNGLVHEESDKIFAVLDKVKAQDLNDIEFKELLLFRTLSRETKFGFTIGGFAPLRKSTLIPVIKIEFF
jgi:hypothetical protein